MPFWLAQTTFVTSTWTTSFLSPASDIVKIRKWLQPTAYDLERSEYSRHRLSHLAGTGKWLTSTTTYQRWYQGEENGILWVKGIPGSGKSVLAASIINQLRKDGIPVIFFFFRQIIDANHQPMAALRDWLCQVLDYSPPLQVKLKEYMENRRDLASLSPSDLWRDLKLALVAFPRVYCVTDALDEMDLGNDEFLHSLVRLGHWRPSNVKVLITSRPVSIVENTLRSFSIPQIRLEESLVDLDIASYVQYKLHHSSISPESWSVIEEAIPGRANGLFLYAKLSMDAFLEPGADAHEVLKALPADLNVMYNDLLREHARRSNVPEDFQLLVLQFVTHATRPLRLLEIAEMANTVQASASRSLKETKNLVRAACGPLLEILPDETVSVVHHSFTEFLKGSTRSSELDDTIYPILQPGSTNKCLAIACLAYLRSGCLVYQELEETSNVYEYGNPKAKEHLELKLRFPFLMYAADDWYTHIRRAVSAGVDMSSVYAMLDAFVGDKRMFAAWRVLSWPTHETRGVTALHVAAWAGLDEYVAYLLERGSNIEVRDDCQNTPLYWAAASGYSGVVQLLLANGADPNAEQNQGYSSLHVAAERNHAAVARLLLAAGVNPLTPKMKDEYGDRTCGNSPTSLGHTPLMYACHHGHFNTVAEFLPFLKDSQVYHRALYWAAHHRQCAVVELIIQYPGVDINGKYRGDTALFIACLKGDEKTIDVLLRAGADPNIYCEQAGDEFCRGVDHTSYSKSDEDQECTRGYTALHALCQSYRDLRTPELLTACLYSLLQAGADIDVRTPRGQTALHFACEHQKADVVKILLEAGADPAAEDDSGATPLHKASYKGAELFPVLLSTGVVDINKVTAKTGKTPLHIGLEGLWVENTLTFFEFNPDVNIPDAKGDSPLHYAVAAFRSDYDEILSRVFDTLISLGANPNAMNNEGNSPLHTTREQSSPLISKLLNAGADLEARNHDGQTALFKHANRDEEPFETLIALGARLDTRDFDGRTLLHRCCNDTNRLDHLIGLGLDPLATDYQGNSLLMEVAATERYYTHPAIMAHLINLGLDIDMPNHRGRTTLHVLCARVELVTYSFSLEHTLDYVLGVCKNPSPSDCDGVQPLHLAATISESYVVKLLNAGANMLKVTHEGMSVLHIAARARQPNIVALCCSRLSALGVQDKTAFLNRQTKDGETALHYACRSGRPETVRTLLEAGADPTILDIERPGVLVNDHKRPFLVPPRRDESEDCNQQNAEHDTVRLDEILDLLVGHGALSPGKDCFRGALDEAISNRLEYTVDCLSRLQSRLPDSNPCPIEGLSYAICKGRSDATREAFRKYGGLEDCHDDSSESSRLDYAYMRNLVFARQYDLFEEGMKRLNKSKPNYSTSSLLHFLVAWGYRDLLDRVCIKDAALSLDDHKWCEEVSIRLGEDLVEPLLVTACDRALPNMDVVELLVEKVGVSLDAHFMRNSLFRSSIVAGGALHRLALGHNWWHVHQALPYLIQKGANLDLRDEHGVTPLHEALHTRFERGPFLRDAAKLLIESGADVNAVDFFGNTCLSKAGGDLEMTRLLMAHGAHITAAAIFSAIEIGEVEVLETLLSHGDYANIRRSEPVIPRQKSDYDASILDSEVSPLLFSSVPNLRYTENYFTNRRGCLRDSASVSLDKRIMEVLLNHGADPFTTYVGGISQRWGMGWQILPHLDEPDLSNPDIEPPRNTVIHQILKSGHLFWPFFQLPSLELERRDSTGCTLLLAASQSAHALHEKMDFVEGGTTIAKTIFQELIDRGADVMAQDNDGNTILHHICPPRGSFLYIIPLWEDSDLLETLYEVVMKNPGLVHLRDRKGESIFHRTLALENFDLIDPLLQLGVDPLQPDSNGDTALHHLAKHLTEDEPLAHFKRFLELGVDINSRNHHGDTPLFKYIQNGVKLPTSSWTERFEKEDDLTETVFDFFEEAGADFLAQNNVGSSLLHLLASKKEYDDYSDTYPYNVVRRFKILMGRGLDPMLEDVHERTSLDVAAVHGSEHIMKLFARKPMD
ncbi:uncharacterized protein N7500_004598 [Penicillium coprophilum]|uniref:uncharacterized protein n=1 Tax=Penicillium coprophilum TaxID=36646 RepID=UPI0023908CD4|nr:uncharacterized protein N7500_004598 [Penicillium coprophilum]KAJ5162768.1 hypothetical protein N7500_004598 [Penicillium coprophilum]